MSPTPTPGTIVPRRSYPHVDDGCAATKDQVEHHSLRNKKQLNPEYFSDEVRIGKEGSPLALSSESDDGRKNRKRKVDAQGANW